MITSTRSRLVAAVLPIATLAFAPFASAALETRTWVGETNSGWNTNANWSPASAPLASDRIAAFDAPSTYQPAIFTHVTVIAGIWMTGNTVGNITITSDPAGQNSGAPTFQTNGNIINGNASTGILMDNTSAGSLTIATSAFKVGGSQNWTNNSSNLLTMSAPMNLNGQALTINGSGTTLISGAVTNSTGVGSIVKDGAGTLTLSSATNTLNGSTTINNGTLLVTGTIGSHSSAVVTANTGTLGGTGTIARNIVINADGILSPGTTNTVAGTFSTDRNLTLSGTAAFDIISSGSHDKLSVNASNATSRTLSLGGTLQVSAPGVSFANGQTFDLIDWGTNTTVTGAFTNIILPVLPPGLSWETFGSQTFDYSTGSISVVPEPASLGLLALAGFAARRRRT